MLRHGRTEKLRIRTEEEIARDNLEVAAALHRFDEEFPPAPMCGTTPDDAKRIEEKLRRIDEELRP